MISAPDAVGMAEPWAGVFIALSVCSYIRRRPLTALAFGMAALFMRELAAPYVIACASAGVLKRKRAESIGWLVGMGAYAAFYWSHWMQVSAHRIATDTAHAHSWIAFGGLGFLLSTVQWQGWLSLLPSWATGVALATIAAGLLAPSAPGSLRIAAGLYAGAFLVVGQPFNLYWGFLAWPSWCLALGLGASTLATDARWVVRSLAGWLNGAPPVARTSHSEDDRQGRRADGDGGSPDAELPRGFQRLEIKVFTIHPDIFPDHRVPVRGEVIDDLLANRR
jgi:hypothetical protein